MPLNATAREHVRLCVKNAVESLQDDDHSSELIISALNFLVGAASGSQVLDQMLDDSYLRFYQRDPKSMSRQIDTSDADQIAEARELFVRHVREEIERLTPPVVETAEPEAVPGGAGPAEANAKPVEDVAGPAKLVPQGVSTFWGLLPTSPANQDGKKLRRTAKWLMDDDDYDTEATGESVYTRLKSLEHKSEIWSYRFSNPKNKYDYRIHDGRSLLQIAARGSCLSDPSGGRFFPSYLCREIDELVNSKRWKILNTLLAHGNVNAQDGKGRTALHIAAKRGDTMLCKLLMWAGAKINIRDNKGRTVRKSHWFKGNRRVFRDIDTIEELFDLISRQDRVDFPSYEKDDKSAAAVTCCVLVETARLAGEKGQKVKPSHARLYLNLLNAQQNDDKFAILFLMEQIAIRSCMNVIKLINEAVKVAISVSVNIEVCVEVDAESVEVDAEPVTVDAEPVEVRAVCVDCDA